MAEGLDLKLTEDDERRILDLTREEGVEPARIVRYGITMIEQRRVGGQEDWSPEYRAYLENAIAEGLASGPSAPMESADELIGMFEEELRERR